MRLIDNFGCVFLKLWSVRLAILAGLLTGIEVILPLFQHEFPRGLFAVASFAVTMASIVARAIAQPSIHRKNDDDQ